MKKLFHYAHCPFCVRVRMTLGFLGTTYQSIVVPYDDEKTPVDLTGVKMLPIMQFEDGKAMNESLDIIKRLDSSNRLKMELIGTPKQDELEVKLKKLGELVHSLCMPYWIYTPEFDDISRAYFQKKKEVKRGPFHLLVKDKRESFQKELEAELLAVEKELKPFYNSDQLTILDIMLAAHIWGLYVLPEFQFTPKIHQYLQNIKNACHFNYHGDFWQEAHINFRKKMEVKL
jgi:glutaredoxin 2